MKQSQVMYSHLHFYNDDLQLNQYTLEISELKHPKVSSGKYETPGLLQDQDV